MPKKYFVVSDVHSFYKKLQDTLNINGFEVNNPNHILILCGDLFDRGPDSLQLYEFVKSLGDRFIYVRGNHEDLLFDLARELVTDRPIKDIHYSNGTIRTVAAFCGINERQFAWPTSSLRATAVDSIKPVLDFINSKSVDYFELSNFIFVHGWIPCKTQKGMPPYYRYGRTYSYDPGWRSAQEDDWAAARWFNGMELAHENTIIEPNKTIVCGHWHCSFGWSQYKQDRKEFPPKDRAGWEKSFEPYRDTGIIAIDACTAYSGLINCIIIED